MSIDVLHRSEMHPDGSEVYLHGGGGGMGFAEGDSVPP